MWILKKILRKILNISLNTSSDTRVYLSNYSRFPFEDYDVISFCTNTYIDTYASYFDFSIKNKNSTGFNISPYTKSYENTFIMPYVNRNGLVYSMNLDHPTRMITQIGFSIGSFHFYGGSRTVHHIISVDGIGEIYRGIWDGVSAHGELVEAGLGIYINALTFPEDITTLVVRVTITSGSDYVLYNSADIIAIMCLKTANGSNKPKNLNMLVVEK